MRPMRSEAIRWLSVVTMATATLRCAEAEGRSQAEARRELMKRLGVQADRGKKKGVGGNGETDRKRGRGEAAPTEVRGGGGRQRSDKERSEGGPSERTAKAGARAAVTFSRDVEPLIQTRCAGCHSSKGSASKSRYLLSGNFKLDYGATRRWLNMKVPSNSRLLSAAMGKGHSGGVFLKKSESAYRQLVAWISSGAPIGSGVAIKQKKPREASRPPPNTGALQRVSRRQRTHGLSAAENRELGAAAGRSLFVDSLDQPLRQACGSCHGANTANQRRYLIGPSAAEHYTQALKHITPGASSESALLTKAIGRHHGGGAIIKASSALHQNILTWIEFEGVTTRRRIASNSDGASQVAKGAPSAAEAVADGATSQAGLPAGSGCPFAHGSRAGRSQATDNVLNKALGSLVRGFRLNGRFDLNYERRNLRDHPFRESNDALRSYHHFVFLSREVKEDPIGLTVELITLQLWELTYGYRFEKIPLKLTARVGKILVPFGADPLYHQRYGGLAGFDQKLLPAIWTQEGVALKGVYRWRQWALGLDAFVTRGFSLREERAVLNLQADLSAIDELKFAGGARVGIAWGPLSLWYSSFFNPLGFGRLLFMQALDLVAWRPRGVAVLERFSASLGFMRADVTGGEGLLGGPNDDYYHFGSYFQLRFYPCDVVYVQYRQGLRSFDNRSGVFIDERRLTSADASTHTIGAVARYRGLSFGWWFFWNLEKVDEVNDDFMRITVAYDF